MDAAQDPRRRRAQGARGVVDVRGDADERRIDGVHRHREEPDEIGEDESGYSPGDDEAGGHAEDAAREIVDAVVDPGERQQGADGHHRPGDRVAQAGDAARGASDRPQAQPGGVGDDEGGRHGEERRQRGEEETGSGERAESRVRPAAPARDGPGGEPAGGQEESEGERRKAGGRRQARAPAGQAPGEDPTGPAGGVMVARAAPLPSLGGQHREHENQQHGGQLRGGPGVAEGEPRPVDAGREGVDAVIVDRAEVAQRLHERECDAAGERRPGERQGDAGEAAPRAAAQGAPNLKRADRLVQEGGAGEQIDVRVESQREDHDGPAERADVGEPVIAPRPAEGLAQRRLHRPGIFEHAGIGVGDGPGGKRQRQQQRPLEDRAAGEAAHGAEPCGAGADDEGGESDAEKQPQRVRDIAGENGVDEMRPDIPRGKEEVGENDDDRRRNGGGDRRRRGREDAGRCGPQRASGGAGQRQPARSASSIASRFRSPSAARGRSSISKAPQPATMSEDGAPARTGIS